ncbi:Site-specific recombinase XerD [Desulfosporosinus sp. I2]|uniref:tyrosine-type recombinase/integrase n=1 Tax=Desulfosporosinus sp. I2 TaxID=1617025 RepID=UPI00061E93F8|nr:tyrosine-type recombinase/integrase [Desulfosporosinus sp. I2]KJR44982.1 Site-specific recombinase XerD [Desulfosporosinus sp. I2]
MDRELILAKYLRDKRKLAQITKNSYCQSIQNLYRFCPHELRKITHKDIIAWLNYLRERKSCTPATIRARLSAVKSFFTYLTEEEIIAYNPLIGLKGPKLGTKSPPTLPTDAIFYLREATIENLRLGTLIEVLFATGVRVTELINIKLQDIYWDENAILITIGKRKSQRFVFFTDICRCLMEEYIESRQDDCPYLFINHHNKQLTRQGVFYLLKNIAKTCIDTNIYPHLFRHSLAAILIEMGAQLQEVADILGHKNLNNVRIYAQFSSKARKKVYDRYF